MKKFIRGFTLIELMVTVAIVGLLAAIAYPSYLNQVRKSRRSEARSALLQAANREERFYTTQYEYTTTLGNGGLGMPTVTEHGAYSLKITKADKTAFKISAGAVGDQTNDECTTMTIDNIGEKTATDGSGADVSDTCW